MAASDQPQGYWCNFVDSVPEDLLCKSCTKVARRFSVTECCGESYCYTCIKDTQQEGKPCPKCGTENFSIYKQPKYQKRVENIPVFCSMKERGCGWSGKLEQLDTHLDPDQDNCQFVDSLCPLNCQKSIPRNKVSQHVMENCVERDYICQHCGFNATYQEVVSIHIPECKYVPLQCPNRCGVTCEREDMEDHMKMCRLEEVECEFEKVGCNRKFKRENEGEHFHEHFPQHLTMTAAKCVKIRDELQQKIQDQEQKIENQEQKLKDQDKQIKYLNQKLQEQLKVSIAENQEKLCLQEQKFMKLFMHLFKCSEIFRSFEMKNFNTMSKSFWKSPVMYTHVAGYKFFIGMQNIEYGYSTGGRIGITGLFGISGASKVASFASNVSIRYLRVTVHVIQGEYDEELKWPVRASFTIQIINQEGGENKACTIETEQSKCGTKNIDVVNAADGKLLTETSLLKEFSHNDTLYFQITNITLHDF